MAELADAPDSKSGYGDIVWVRFPLSAVLNRKIVSFGFFNIKIYTETRVFKNCVYLIR